MCDAKNNSCVMRTRNRVASGPVLGSFRKEEAEIPLAASSHILGESI